MRAKDLNDLVRYSRTKFQISTAIVPANFSTRLLGMVAGGSQPAKVGVVGSNPIARSN
jgi:hypothetical protein